MSLCHRNHFFFFRNEHAQSTTLGPKLKFGVVSRHFVAARDPMRKQVSRCIQGKSLCNRNHFFFFSQRTCPIHYFRSKTHVWGGFVPFRCRTEPIANTGIGVHTRQEFVLPEPFLLFSQRTCPIHYFRSKTHVFEGFVPFRRCTRPVAETSIGVHLIECFRTVGLQTYYLKDFNALLQVQKSHFGHFAHHFGALKHPFGFAPHTLRLKLVFQVVSHHFVAAPDPL